MVFSPVISLDGFKVETSFDIEQLTCTDLGNDLYQLGVILYPADKINEKFLIKLRDCVVKLPESHPVKRWMKSIATTKPPTKEEQKLQKFLSDIINSQFNLITDSKTKTEIINIIDDVPENTLPEQLLKSYLYLMIGNITRSDNILRDIIGSPPRVNWEKSGKSGSFFHKLSVTEARQIFLKFGRHPADRKTFQLFSLYIQSFYNDQTLIAMADETDTSEVEEKIGLKVIETLAPSFVHYVRLSNLSENLRIKSLRNSDFPLEEQSYWFWAFMDIEPLISEHMLPELERLEKDDQMWFIYLIENEKLADLVSKKSGKSFLPGRRPFLKEGLHDKRSFMMSLYKLIELGDINPELVQKTTDFLIHE